MAITGAGRWALVLTSFAFLAACEQGKPLKLFDKPLFGGNRTASAGDTAPAAATGTTVEEDVESPEVFQKTDAGLWDGRPSLGGVWIAYPDVAAPERVIIRNLDNGKSIIGALFRRERANPGPKFQVSSDAAAELGMLAGAPARLNVTALRRVEVPVEPAASEAPAPGGAGPAPATASTPPVPRPARPVANSGIEQTTLDPVTEMAASAIEAATAAQAGDRTETPAPPPRSALEKPYVQIGIFAVKANAEDTAKLLRNSGIVPTIRKFETNGKPYWRIVVGPVTSKADRKAIIRKVAGLGFGDAYPVTN